MDIPALDFEQQLDALLRAAGRQAITSPTAEAFAGWFLAAAPAIFPALLDKVPPDPRQRESFLRAAAGSVYGAMPLPANGWVATGQVKQERNARCACGSGRKYKHCCGAVSMPPLLGNLNYLRYVLDACPKSRLGDVARSRAKLDAVEDTAHQWIEEGEPARAAALLAPYFKAEGPLQERLAPIFNLLMGAWLDLGHPLKRERLIDDILRRGDRVLRSDALQRRTTMLADRGEHAAAWQSFKQASALNPNDPALSFLEVTTLVSEGRTTEAQGRAQWWAAFLARQRDPELDDLIESLRDIARDPQAGMLGVALQSNAQWNRLHELLLAAPTPALRHTFEIFTEQDKHRVTHRVAAELVPDAALAGLEERWQEVFEQVKPSLTAVQNDASEVWHNATQWLDLLEHNPELWCSFDVLDDLVMAVDTIHWQGVQERLLVPIAERAAEQLRLTLESEGGGPIECHWGVWPNRPALRPVAHLAFVCQEAGNWERFMELAHWLVFELNPNDNHGLRADLSSAYARFERWDDVRAVHGRYPDDMNPTLVLNCVLATFMQGQGDDAATMLKQAARDHPRAVKMLLAQAPKPVPPDGEFGVSAGGSHEAWLYVGAMRPLWERHKALDWARLVLDTPRRRSPGVPPGQLDLL